LLSVQIPPTVVIATVCVSNTACSRQRVYSCKGVVKCIDSFKQYLW